MKATKVEKVILALAATYFIGNILISLIFNI